MAAQTQSGQTNGPSQASQTQASAQQSAQPQVSTASTTNQNQTTTSTAQQSQQTNQSPSTITIPGTNIQIPTSMAAANGFINPTLQNVKVEGAGKNLTHVSYCLMNFTASNQSLTKYL